MIPPAWQRLRDGGTLLGGFLSLGSAVAAEIVGQAGFDFVIIDLEHGAGAEADVLSQLQALEATGTPSVVRVESTERQRAHRVLDAGAHGVMFPRVDTPAEAQAAIAALRYPPEGVRGVATLVRAAAYGASFDDYSAASAQGLLGVIQIESEQAVAHVDEIAAIDGAGVLFVGPMDLSRALGIFRQFDHPRFLDALERTVAAASRHRRAAGILLMRPEDLPRYRDLGFRFFTCGADAGWVATGARATARRLRELAK